VGDWYRNAFGFGRVNGAVGHGGLHSTFVICAPWDVVNSHIGAQSQYYLWVTGTRPSAVFASTDVPSVAVDGETYSVWTTNALNAVGLGFILRWRAYSINSTNATWVSPPAGWTTYVPPASDGIPFYQANYIEHHLDGNAGIFYYGAQVEVRYVLIKPTNSIPDANPVYSISPDVTTELVILKGRAASHSFTGQATASQKLTVRMPPSGTCMTPTVEEGTVHFGGVFPSSFPDNQWGEAAYKDFTLTFRNCPWHNVTYYVHANGNRWVGGPGQSVVGVQGSVPGDPNPITGNPSGFGIQLQHRTGNHQHSGNVYIHPNEAANPLSLPDTQSYTRNWQGAGTSISSSYITHTIPMRAVLVRTGSSSQQQITPGAFTTSVIVAISYP